MEQRREFYTIFRKERERRQDRLWVLHHVITTQDINAIREIIGDEIAASLQLKLLFDCPSSSALSEDFEYNHQIYVAAKSCVPAEQRYMYYHLQNGSEREDSELLRTCMSWKEVKEEFGHDSECPARPAIAEGAPLHWADHALACLRAAWQSRTPPSTGARSPSL